MKRRTFLLQTGGALAGGSTVFAAVQQGKLDAAEAVLREATASGQVAAASLSSRERGAKKSPFVTC